MDDDDAGAAHSATPGPTTRAAAVISLRRNLQRIVADSRKPPLDGPNTDTRVPPATGPDGGTSALTCSAPCT